MKYTGLPEIATYQIGETVWTIENDVPVSAKITELRVIVTLADVVDTNFYKLEGYGERYFPESELQATSNDLKEATF